MLPINIKSKQQTIILIIIRDPHTINVILTSWRWGTGAGRKEGIKLASATIGLPVGRRHSSLSALLYYVPTGIRVYPLHNSARMSQASSSRPESNSPLSVAPSDLVAWLTPNMDNPVPVDVDTLYEQREVAALWQVPLKGQVHKIEFEHGTASGRRVIWLDGKEMLRREWMFKLVGEDSFQLHDVRCIIRVEPAPGFRYTYHLFVDGKPFKQFADRQARILKAWETSVGGMDYRIVLGK